MKYKPFTSKHCTPSRFTSPLQQADAVEKAKTAGKFLAQESAGQDLKKFAGNVASKAFGVAGMLLSSQKVYGGGEFKGGTYISPEEQKEQFGLIPEETSEQFLARTKNEG